MTVVEIRDNCDLDCLYAIAMSRTMAEDELVDEITKAKVKAMDEHGERSWCVDDLVENLPDEVEWYEPNGYMEI